MELEIEVRKPWKYCEVKIHVGNISTGGDLLDEEECEKFAKYLVSVAYELAPDSWCSGEWFKRICIEEGCLDEQD